MWRVPMSLVNLHYSISVTCHVRMTVQLCCLGQTYFGNIAAMANSTIPSSFHIRHTVKSEGHRYCHLSQNTCWINISGVITRCSGTSVYGAGATNSHSSYFDRIHWCFSSLAHWHVTQQTAYQLSHHHVSQRVQFYWYLPLENWRRPPGRPRTMWMKTIQQVLKSKNLPWTKQSLWLRIVHSGDWCLRLALGTPSGACHERSYIQKLCDNSFLDKLNDAEDHARQMEWSNRPGRVWRRFLTTFGVSFPDTVHHVIASWRHHPYQVWPTFTYRQTSQLSPLDIHSSHNIRQLLATCLHHHLVSTVVSKLNYSSGFYGVNSPQHVHDSLVIRMGKHKSSYLLTYWQTGYDSATLPDTARTVSLLTCYIYTLIQKITYKQTTYRLRYAHLERAQRDANMLLSIYQFAQNNLTIVLWYTESQLPDNQTVPRRLKISVLYFIDSKVRFSQHIRICFHWS